MAFRICWMKLDMVLRYGGGLNGRMALYVAGLKL
jgi:hypothetical protein